MKSIAIAAAAAVALAVGAAPAHAGSTLPSPVVLTLVLGALSLAPFLLIMLTSFVKISVVLSILRNAIGTQQIPPNQVITGFAFVLTIFIMTPVATKMYDAARPSMSGTSAAMMSEGSIRSLVEGAERGREPLRDFLVRHAHGADVRLFLGLAQGLERTENIYRTRPLDDRSFQIVIPAFVTSELKEAFLVGFVIFIPFLIIDLVVANILMALGMHMMNATSISLPFKLLFFVLINGWSKISEGLVFTYIDRTFR